MLVRGSAGSAAEYHQVIVLSVFSDGKCQTNVIQWCVTQGGGPGVALITDKLCQCQ